MRTNSCSVCAGIGVIQNRNPGVSPIVTCYHCDGRGLVSDSNSLDLIWASKENTYLEQLADKDKQLANLNTQIRRRDTLLQNTLKELRAAKKELEVLKSSKNV